MDAITRQAAKLQKVITDSTDGMARLESRQTVLVGKIDSTRKEADAEFRTVEREHQRTNTASYRRLLAEHGDNFRTVLAAMYEMNGRNWNVLQTDLGIRQPGWQEAIAAAKALDVYQAHPLRDSTIDEAATVVRDHTMKRNRNVTDTDRSRRTRTLPGINPKRSQMKNKEAFSDEPVMQLGEATLED